MTSNPARRPPEVGRSFSSAGPSAVASHQGASRSGDAASTLMVAGSEISFVNQLVLVHIVMFRDFISSNSCVQGNQFYKATRPAPVRRSTHGGRPPRAPPPPRTPRSRSTPFAPRQRATAVGRSAARGRAPARLQTASRHPRRRAGMQRARGRWLRQTRAPRASPSMRRPRTL